MIEKMKPKQDPIGETYHNLMRKLFNMKMFRDAFKLVYEAKIS
jgi:hypothetical protein